MKSFSLAWFKKTTYTQHTSVRKKEKSFNLRHQKHLIHLDLHLSSFMLCIKLTTNITALKFNTTT